MKQYSVDSRNIRNFYVKPKLHARIQNEVKQILAHIRMTEYYTALESYSGGANIESWEPPRLS
jgi:hypothetical protein